MPHQKQFVFVTLIEIDSMLGSPGPVIRPKHTFPRALLFLARVNFDISITQCAGTMMVLRRRLVSLMPDSLMHVSPRLLEIWM
jgi:hypothetical protein